MRSKKERRQRVEDLIIAWLERWSTRLKARGNVPMSREELSLSFGDFCREKEINRPQDKTLRHTILILSGQYLKEAEARLRDKIVEQHKELHNVS